MKEGCISVYYGARGLTGKVGIMCSWVSFQEQLPEQHCMYPPPLLILFITKVPAKVLCQVSLIFKTQVPCLGPIGKGVWETQIWGFRTGKASNKETIKTWSSIQKIWGGSHYPRYQATIPLPRKKKYHGGMESYKAIKLQPSGICFKIMGLQWTEGVV